MCYQGLFQQFKVMIGNSFHVVYISWYPMDYSHDSTPNTPYEDKWVSLYIIPKNTQIILRITVYPMVIILNISKIPNNWYIITNDTHLMICVHKKNVP